MSELALLAPADRERFDLHEEDSVAQGEVHWDQLECFKFGLGLLLPDWFVASDFAIYWVPGAYRTPWAGADVLIARNRPAQDEATVFLTYEDGPISFVGEVASKRTRRKEAKKRDEVYAATLQVPEYLFVDHKYHKLELKLLTDGHYDPVAADSEGRLWSPGLGVGFVWPEGERLVRVVSADGRVMPTPEEAEAQRADAEGRADVLSRLVEAERTRADAERHRADDLAAELERLRKLLGSPD